jgi:FMN phosphatase YigB (HAD superfamily)
MKKLLLDFDGCLAYQNRDAGIGRITHLLGGIIGDKALKIGTEFGQINEGMESILHGKTDRKLLEFRKRLNSYEVVLPKEIESQKIDFMWSRELWLKYLSDKYKLCLDKRIITLIKEFWEAVALASPLYPQVVSYLKNAGIHGIFIITGSDQDLLFRNGSIIYDPAYAEKMKIRRLRLQGLTMLPRKNIITGDPYDKPSLGFWKKVMDITRLSKTSDGIVVDDSLPMVLASIKMGFNGYLLDRKGLYERKDVEKQVDGYITELDQLNFEAD